MKKQEEFQLKFEKRNIGDGYIYDHCEHLGNTNKYQFIAHLLPMFSVPECKSIVDAIDKALNNRPYSPEHGPDSLSDDDELEIIPPHVIYGGGEWKMLMRDWKQLMEEWIEFRNSKPDFMTRFKSFFRM